ncbi:MAG TPA: hypothetical protein VKU86_11245 [Acidimicrobiales bacterium]|nr:hypothetical protein [Acidimicrobiales bacterium]
MADALLDERFMQPSGEELADDDLTDDELCRLALAADPDQSLAPDAVPVDVYLGLAPPGQNLPVWYMAPVRARSAGRLRRIVILAVVGAFVVIEAFGLCSSYGQWPFH